MGPKSTTICPMEIQNNLFYTPMLCACALSPRAYKSPPLSRLDSHFYTILLDSFYQNRLKTLEWRFEKRHRQDLMSACLSSSHTHPNGRSSIIVSSFWPRRPGLHLSKMTVKPGDGNPNTTYKALMLAASASPLLLRLYIKLPAFRKSHFVVDDGMFAAVYKTQWQQYHEKLKKGDDSLMCARLFLLYLAYKIHLPWLLRYPSYIITPVSSYSKVRPDLFMAIKISSLLSHVASLAVSARRAIKNHL